MKELNMSFFQPIMNFPRQSSLRADSNANVAIKHSTKVQKGQSTPGNFQRESLRVGFGQD